VKSPFGKLRRLAQGRTLVLGSIIYCKKSINNGLSIQLVIDAFSNHTTHNRANIANITFYSTGSEALLILLHLEGNCASSGSACLANSDEPSHIIKAMKPESAASRQIARFSLSQATSAGETTDAVNAVQ
jgi:cysteine sulfinate desulfinase/cysteine desulfurase-like protein